MIQISHDLELKSFNTMFVVIQNIGHIFDIIYRCMKRTFFVHMYNTPCFGVHKTSLATPLFMEVPVPSQKVSGHVYVY